MEVVTEPAGLACEKGLERPRKMIVTALGAEGGARHPLLARLRKRHQGIATRSEGANATTQPGLDLGSRLVVRKRKACLRRLEPCELGTKDVEARLDQQLGLDKRHLRLVHVTIAVWHHVVTARLELVPEAEVALAPLVMPLLVRLSPVPGREDVQLDDQPVALEDLGHPDRRTLERSTVSSVRRSGRPRSSSPWRSKISAVRIDERSKPSSKLNVTTCTPGTTRSCADRRRRRSTRSPAALCCPPTPRTA